MIKLNLNKYISKELIKNYGIRKCKQALISAIYEQLSEWDNELVIIDEIELKEQLSNLKKRSIK